MKFRKTITAAVLAVGTVVPMAAVQSNCSAGTWGGVYGGWGDCRGQGKWKLQVSCTWGASAASGTLRDRAM